MRKLLSSFALFLVLVFPVFAGWSDAWDDEYRIDYGTVTTNYTTNVPPITQFRTRDVLALDMYEAIKERDIILLFCKQVFSWNARPSLGHGPRFYRFEALNFRNIRQWIRDNCGYFVDQGVNQVAYMATNKQICMYNPTSLYLQATSHSLPSSSYYDTWYWRNLNHAEHGWPAAKAMMCLLIEAAYQVNVVGVPIERDIDSWSRIVDPSGTVYAPPLDDGGGIPTAPPTWSSWHDSSWPYTAGFSINGGRADYVDTVYTNPITRHVTYQYSYGVDNYVTMTMWSNPVAYTESLDPIKSISNIVGVVRTLYGNQETGPAYGNGTYTNSHGTQTCSGVLTLATNFYVGLTAQRTLSMTNDASYFYLTETNFSIIHGFNGKDSGPYCELTMLSEDTWGNKSTWIAYWYEGYWVSCGPSYVLIKPTLEYK